MNQDGPDFESMCSYTIWYIYNGEGVYNFLCEVPMTITTLVILGFGNVAIPNLIQLKKVAVNFGLVIAMTNDGITKICPS